MDLFNLLEWPQNQLLAITDMGQRLSIGDLARTTAALERVKVRQQLIFLLCRNDFSTLLGYLGCLQCGGVPLLLDANIASAQLKALSELYHPAFCLVPRNLSRETRDTLPWQDVLQLSDSVLLHTGEEGPPLHSDLALLLTTSGSTGSPKLVRISRKNLSVNAASIAQYLELTEAERPITTLPMNYSYGMSVINSHMIVGAPILLTSHSVLEQKFWDMVHQEGATSLAGVPYTYQMLYRLGFPALEIPSLKCFTQAGGRLPLELHQAFAQWAFQQGKRFCVMYGQTEASPRMAYLPSELAMEKAGSIGIPIPGGTFRLKYENSSVNADADGLGELIYQGENVAMGYAQCPDDLSLGDVWQGVLHTGDMAYRDSDGFYFIAGRKKRFLKLYGNRVSLDEMERMLQDRFPEICFACVGRDDQMTIYTNCADSLFQTILSWIIQQTHLPSRAIRLRSVDAIPKNASGKTLYGELSVD